VQRRAFLATAPPAILFGLATLALVMPSGLDARQATAAVFTLAIAWGFVGAGMWMLARERATRLALRCAGIGCGLFLACWVFSSEPAPFTLGLLFGLIWAPIVRHFVLAFPSGRLQMPVERWLVAAAYAVAIMLQPLPWLFWAGGWDAVCTDCPRNLALIEPHPDLARALLAAFIAAGAVSGLLILGYVVRVRWWRAPALADHGLRAAVEDLAGRSPVDVTIDAAPEGRLPEHVEVAAYFIIAEALANVAKHAGASRGPITVSALRGICQIEVGDDGVGVVDAGQGSGLRGLADRAEALDGRLTVTSAPGEGTTVRPELPCAS
jgi:hypothetical protein